jgi:pilus assembly protein Flp/PilA
MEDRDSMRRLLKLWKDTRGQDLLEYALMVGFVAVTVAVTLPGVSTNVSKIFSKVSSTMSAAAAQS